MEKSSFFNSHFENGEYDRTYQAEDFAEYFKSFIGNGVFPNPSDNCLVEATSKMAVNIKRGLAWINGYFYQNTDDLELSLDVADGVLYRYDSIVLRLDFIERQITAKVIKGDYSSTEETAKVPELQRDSDAYDIKLADVLIEPGVLNIVQSKIFDRRTDSELCGIVHGTVEQVDITDLYKQYESKVSEYSDQFNVKATATYDNFNKRLSDSYLEFTNNFNTWFDTNTESWSSEFNTWFDDIKAQLAGDIATSLQNQIDTLKTRCDSLEKNKISVDVSKVFEGEELTYEDSVDSIIRDLKIYGKSVFVRSDGTIVDTWEDGVSLRSLLDESKCLEITSQSLSDESLQDYKKLIEVFTNTLKDDSKLNSIGDLCDTLDIEGNKITKRTRCIYPSSLDDSAVSLNTSLSNDYRYVINVVLDVKVNTEGTAICNKFRFATKSEYDEIIADTSSSVTQCFAITSDTNLVFIVNKSLMDSSSNSSDDAISLVKNSGIIYPLLEEEEYVLEYSSDEEKNNSPLKSFLGGTKVTVTNSSPAKPTISARFLTKDGKAILDAVNPTPYSTNSVNKHGDVIYGDLKVKDGELVTTSIKAKSSYHTNLIKQAIEYQYGSSRQVVVVGENGKGILKLEGKGDDFYYNGEKVPVMKDNKTICFNNNYEGIGYYDSPSGEIKNGWNRWQMYGTSIQDAGDVNDIYRINSLKNPKVKVGDNEYEIYHEGNNPKRLREIAYTSYTGTDNVHKFFKLATFNITNNYGSYNAEFNIGFTGHSQVKSPHYKLGVWIKRQDSTFNMDLKVWGYNSGIYSKFVLVQTGTYEATLYAHVPIQYCQLYMNLIGDWGSSASTKFYKNETPVSSLPSSSSKPVYAENQDDRTIFSGIIGSSSILETYRAIGSAVSDNGIFTVPETSFYKISGMVRNTNSLYMYPTSGDNKYTLLCMSNLVTGSNDYLPFTRIVKFTGGLNYYFGNSSKARPDWTHVTIEKIVW